MSKPVWGADSLSGGELLIGMSQAISRVRREVLHLAKGNGPTLIAGETGTGKELVARLIHRNSSRSDRSFIPVNCAAIPDSLFESEFFGYERGAFTGAQSRKEGVFDLAHEGTLFLDEIGEASLQFQAKLLRVLDTAEFLRVGGRSLIRRDVRVFAATNRDLQELISHREFRLDLYHRIRVGLIALPPLRERREDIPLLLDHFCAEGAARLGMEKPRISSQVRVSLMDYHWPGNIRELRNIVDNLLLYGPEEIELEHLPEWFNASSGPVSPHSTERERILASLERNHWNKHRTAMELGWSRSTLYRKLGIYGIG